MFLHVTEAKYLHDHVLWLKFNDGVEGEIDLSRELEGEVFGLLQDEENFQKFEVDSILNTVVWKNGADFAPEFLYENMKVLAG